jgi:rubrerythrin
VGSSKENLQTAFAGESQANRRYLFFAQKAEDEGYKVIARLFRAAAEAETIHARNHFTNMGGLGATKDNLEAAIGGEYYEFTKMYPEFIEKAKAEGNQGAERSFVWANKVEEIHHGLYQKAKESLEGGRPLKDEPLFVCQRCGNTVAGAAPDICPVCGAPKKMFKRVD